MKRKVKPSNPKLSKRLRNALLVTLLALLILATIAAGVSAYFLASDSQDDMLLSVAGLVESDQIGAQQNIKNTRNHDFDENAVRVWEVGKANRHGIRIKKNLSKGFHTVLDGDELWRLYVTGKNSSEQQFIVAQQISASAEIAFKSAINTALPLLLLLLVIPLLIAIVVRHSFKPLNRLTEKISHSDELTIDQSGKDSIPVEVLPFVTAIDSLLDKNEAYNQRQRRFIADAAHELRTPITALSLEVENVQSAKNEDDKKHRQATLSSSVVRLQRLVNQLLDLARVQAAAPQKKHVVNLNELVKDNIADLYSIVESKNINLVVTRIDAVPVLDKNNQLQHLIRNGLSNAFKFAPDAGEVIAEVYQTGNEAVFSVRDNGPGVQPDMIDNLHQPFYHTEGQSSGQGAGLGLAICHEIASLLEGRLTLQNTKPHGFKFCYRQAVASESQSVQAVSKLSG